MLLYLLSTAELFFIRYKNNSLFIISSLLSVIIEVFSKGHVLGVSVLFLLLMSCLYTADFFSGVLASRKMGNKILSSKISYTVMKFFILFLWIWISYQIKDIMKDLEWLRLTVSVLSTFPLALISLREFISIGENIEIIYGKRPYLFNLVGKLFSLIESLFIHEVASKDLTETNNNEGTKNSKCC